MRRDIGFALDACPEWHRCVYLCSVDTECSFCVCVKLEPCISVLLNVFRLIYGVLNPRCCVSSVEFVVCPA
jgi:hypothetical protein